MKLEFNAAGHRADLLRLAEVLVLVWVLIRLRSTLEAEDILFSIKLRCAAPQSGGVNSPAATLIFSQSPPRRAASPGSNLVDARMNKRRQMPGATAQPQLCSAPDRWR